MTRSSVLRVVQTPAEQKTETADTKDIHPRFELTQDRKIIANSLNTILNNIATKRDTSENNYKNAQNILDSLLVYYKLTLQHVAENKVITESLKKLHELSLRLQNNLEIWLTSPNEKAAAFSHLALFLLKPTDTNPLDHISYILNNSKSAEEVVSITKKLSILQNLALLGSIAEFLCIIYGAYSHAFFSDPLGITAISIGAFSIAAAIYGIYVAARPSTTATLLKGSFYMDADNIVKEFKQDIKLDNLQHYIPK